MGWPAEGRELGAYLAASHTRLALMRNGREAKQAIQRLADALEARVVSVGKTLASLESVVPDQIPKLLQNDMVLVDLDILFWPTLALNPLKMLLDLARLGPRIALWPGLIQNGRVLYSEPGRRDYFDSALSASLVLRPRAVSFPDETPYALEGNSR